MNDVAAVNANDDDHDDNRVQVPSENDPRVQITLDLATRSLYSEPTRNFGVFFLLVASAFGRRCAEASHRTLENSSGTRLVTTRIGEKPKGFSTVQTV